MSRSRKAQADLAISDNQDKVDLLKSQYGGAPARELEVQRNELLAAIDAKKNLLNLEEAKRAAATNSRAISNHATNRRWLRSRCCASSAIRA